jgi:integrase
MDHGDALKFFVGITDPEVLQAAVDAAKAKQDELNRGRARSHKLKDGVRLYFNGKSPVYWVNIALSGIKDGARRSTGVGDLEEAKRVAYGIEQKVRAEYEAGTLKEFGKKTGYSWTKICWDVYHVLDNKAKAITAKTGNTKPQPKVHASIIKNYLAEREEWKGKSIHHVGYPELCAMTGHEDFDEVSKTFARNTKKALSIIFEYAELNRVVKKEQIPRLPDIQAEASERREPFENRDRELFLSNMPNFYENSTNFISRNVRRQLPFYFNLLCTTGMRTGEEPLNLRWCDIQKQDFKYKDGSIKQAYVAVIRFGKMAKETVENKKKDTLSREAILNSDAVSTIERLYFVRYGIKLSINEMIKLGKTDTLFIGNKNAKPDFRSSFNQYHDYINKGKVKLNRRYTLYSCRHEYINAELDKGHMKLQDIADQVGSSPETIHKFYLKYKAIHRAARILTPEDIAKFNPEPE